MEDYSKNNTNIRSVPGMKKYEVKKKVLTNFLLNRIQKWCVTTNLLLPVLMVSTLFIPAGHAYAEAIGMSAIATPHIGYAAGVAYVNVDDPDGPTERAWIFRPFTLVYTDKITTGINYRYWAELYYQEASLDASTSNVGQFIKQYGIRFSMQRNIWKNNDWNSWFGAGLDMANSKYEDRHLVDSAGFLTTRFDDRQELEFGVLINFNGEISLARNVVFSAKAEQVFATGDGIDSLSFSAVFLYRL